MFLNLIFTKWDILLDYKKNNKLIESQKLVVSK